MNYTAIVLFNDCFSTPPLVHSVDFISLPSDFIWMINLAEYLQGFRFRIQKSVCTSRNAANIPPIVERKKFYVTLEKTLLFDTQT